MIVPAIIPKSQTDLETKLKLVSFSQEVQIDLVDGKFDDDISWPYEPEGEVRLITKLIESHKVEADLMVESPLLAARDWLLAGAKAIVFHLESLKEPDDAVVLRKEFDFELGLAISSETSLESLYPHIEKINYVQLMGIKEIGSQGQPFNPETIERVATLRHLYPDLTISIDGGVSEDNIESLKNAGASRFVVGSNILKSSNPKAQYEKLLKIVS